MRGKQAFPLVAIPLVAAVVLGVLWLLRPRDDVAIRRVLLEHIRGVLTRDGKREGDDYTVGAIEILGQDSESALALVPLRIRGESRSHFFAVRRRGAAWNVEHDLAEHFRAQAEGPAFVRAVSERLAKVMLERLRMTVSVTMVEGKPFQYQLLRDGDSVVAKCRFAFLIPREDGKQERIEYVEDFRYRDGRWEVAGTGQILQFRDVR